MERYIELIHKTWQGRLIYELIIALIAAIVIEWLVPRVYRFFLGLLSSFSRKRRISFLINQLFRLRALKGESEFDDAKISSILTYRATRHVVKGLIWLVLGLVPGSLVSVISIIGFLGCLYYLFLASEILQPIKVPAHPKSIDEEIAKIKDELKSYPELADYLVELEKLN